MLKVHELLIRFKPYSGKSNQMKNVKVEIMLKNKFDLAITDAKHELKVFVLLLQAL